MNGTRLINLLYVNPPDSRWGWSANQRRAWENNEFQFDPLFPPYPYFNRHTYNCHVCSLLIRGRLHTAHDSHSSHSHSELPQ